MAGLLAGEVVVADLVHLCGVTERAHVRDGHLVAAVASSIAYHRNVASAGVARLPCGFVHRLGAGAPLFGGWQLVVTIGVSARGPDGRGALLHGDDFEAELAPVAHRRALASAFLVTVAAIRIGS